MKVVFSLSTDQDGRHCTGSGGSEHKVKKMYQIIFLKVYPFARAQKFQGVTIKSRHGNSHFTKKKLYL